MNNRKFFSGFPSALPRRELRAAYSRGSEPMGDGCPHRAVFPLERVSGIAVEGFWKGRLICGGRENVCMITMDGNLLPLAEVYCRGGVLHIRQTQPVFSKRIPRFELRLCEPPETLDISGVCRVKIPDLRTRRFVCRAAGASQLRFPNGEWDFFQMKLEGAGKAVISGSCRKAFFSAAGAGKLRFNGELERLQLHLSGAAKAKIGEAQHVDVTAAGAGKIQLSVKKELIGTVSGTSTLLHSGSAECAVQTFGFSHSRRDDE